MSLFQWLTTGSFNGIYLEQEKEPALSQPFLPFFSAATLQSKPIEHGYDLSHPLSCDQLADIAGRAGIIDEHDGKELASKIRQASKQKISAVCVDAIDDEPYVSSQINPLLHCSSEIVRAANWLASAFDVGERFIAVYKNMSALETKIPSFIDGVEVRRIQVGGVLLGHSIQELDVRRTYAINIIAIERNHQTNVNFSAQYCFQEGDNAAVVGKIENIDRFEADILQ